MPYIDPRIRRTECFPFNTGELSYVLAKAINAYLCDKVLDSESGKVSFAMLNQVTGVLDNLNAEIRRRFLFKLEDEKCQANGDVFTFQDIGKEPDVKPE